MKYITLLRGINVGGNNKVPMAELKVCFEKLGLSQVRTYINSGNVLFVSEEEDIQALQARIETGIKETFGFLVRVLVLRDTTLEVIIKHAPNSFGQEPGMYHSDVAFLFSGDASEYVTEIETNSEVDTVWAGDGVIYYQRLSEKRTKSKMAKMISKPFYKQLTIRNWNTVTKLHALARDLS